MALLTRSQCDVIDGKHKPKLDDTMDRAGEGTRCKAQEFDRQVRPMFRWFPVVLLGSLAAAAGGCEQRTSRVRAPQPAGKLTIMPVEMAVKQRSTTAVPGSDGRLLLTVGDITRGQVAASLATEKGKLVLPSRSMATADAATFRLGDAPYSLSLKQLDNALIGEDFAAFVITSPADAVLTEDEKIERLIGSVAELKEAVFIRNDAEHTAAEAAEHLRRKWRAAGTRIETAEQFVEAIASRSSLSGKPYRIRMADGEVVKAEEFLRKRLRRLEQASDTERPPETDSVSKQEKSDQS